MPRRVIMRHDSAPIIRVIDVTSWRGRSGLGTRLRWADLATGGGLRQLGGHVAVRDTLSGRQSRFGAPCSG